MKLIITIVSLFLCFCTVTGLKCVTTSDDGKSTSNQDCSSKYCFTAHLTENYQGYKRDETFYGCGNQITPDVVRQYKNAKTCDEFGNGKQKAENDGIHAELYCCDSDLCNSATTYSFIGIIAFVIFMQIFYSF